MKSRNVRDEWFVVEIAVLFSTLLPIRCHLICGWLGHLAVLFLSMNLIRGCCWLMCLRKVWSAVVPMWPCTLMCHVFLLRSVNWCVILMCASLLTFTAVLPMFITLTFSYIHVYTFQELQNKIIHITFIQIIHRPIMFITNCCAIMFYINSYYRLQYIGASWKRCFASGDQSVLPQAGWSLDGANKRVRKHEYFSSLLTLKYQNIRVGLDLNNFSWPRLWCTWKKHG